MAAPLPSCSRSAASSLRLPLLFSPNGNREGARPLARRHDCGRSAPHRALDGGGGRTAAQGVYTRAKDEKGGKWNEEKREGRGGRGAGRLDALTNFSRVAVSPYGICGSKGGTTAPPLLTSARVRLWLWVCRRSGRWAASGRRCPSGCQAARRSSAASASSTCCRPTCASGRSARRRQRCGAAAALLRVHNVLWKL